MGAPMLNVTKPRGESQGKSAVQVNFRLTEYLRWKIYRYAKSHEIGQSDVARLVFTKFFAEEATEQDWRAKKS